MPSTAGAKNEADLPAKARRYLERLEELIGVPFCLISTGAQRDETILCETSPLLRWFPSVRSSLLSHGAAADLPATLRRRARARAAPRPTPAQARRRPHRPGRSRPPRRG